MQRIYNAIKSRVLWGGVVSMASLAGLVAGTPDALGTIMSWFSWIPELWIALTVTGKISLCSLVVGVVLIITGLPQRRDLTKELRLLGALGIIEDALAGSEKARDEEIKRAGIVANELFLTTNLASTFYNLFGEETKEAYLDNLQSAKDFVALKKLSESSGALVMVGSAREFVRDFIFNRVGPNGIRSLDKQSSGLFTSLGLEESEPQPDVPDAQS